MGPTLPLDDLGSMPEARRIRVVYADDDAGHRTGLLRSLVSEPGIDLVAVAVSGEAALAAIERHHPDVALVDLHDPGISGCDVAARIATHHPPLRTRVLQLDPQRTRGEICAALAAAAA